MNNKKPNCSITRILFVCQSRNLCHKTSASYSYVFLLSEPFSPLIKRQSAKGGRSLCLSFHIVSLLLRTEHFPKFYRIIRSPVKIIHHCSILIIFVLRILRPIVRTSYYNLIVYDAILIMH